MVAQARPEMDPRVRALARVKIFFAEFFLLRMRDHVAANSF
jgi:hypothetical protein